MLSALSHCLLPTLQWLFGIFEMAVFNFLVHVPPLHLSSLPLRKKTHCLLLPWVGCVITTSYIIRATALAVVDHPCAVMVMIYDGKSHPSEDGRHKGGSNNEVAQHKSGMHSSGHFPQIKVDYSVNWESLDGKEKPWNFSFFGVFFFFFFCLETFYVSQNIKK